MSAGATRIVSASEADTRAAARALARTLAPGDTVALVGELGTGKTVLVRGICEHFGCLDQVTSPSFTIVNEYDGAIPIVHCDLYRLSTIDEMLAVGIDELWNGDRLCLVEWADRAAGLLPATRIDIDCAYGDSDTERIYTITRRHDAGADSAGRET